MRSESERIRRVVGKRSVLLGTPLGVGAMDAGCAVTVATKSPKSNRLIVCRIDRLNILFPCATVRRPNRLATLEML